MTRVTFRKLTVYGSKSGTCPVCGKRARRKAEFWQTSNPFNKNINGMIKSDDEIYRENIRDMKQWESKPVYHAKCEPVADKVE